jgi:hypothetical protein
VRLNSFIFLFVNTVFYVEHCILYRYRFFLDTFQNLGKVAEWLKAADCKSVEIFLRRFESCLSQKKKNQPEDLKLLLQKKNDFVKASYFSRINKKNFKLCHN